MIKKKLSEYTNENGFSKTEIALLKENNLNLENFSENFPDYNKKITLDSFLKTLTPLKNTDEFIEFVTSRKNEKFCILGDYDADGILSTEIMLIGLRKMGIDVDFVIPNRLENGYGMKNIIIDKALEKKATVLITVDNGIGSKEQIEYALSKGISVLITDHHLPEENTTPENVIIIDPKYNKDCFSDICGAFVAFKLIFELLKSEKIFDNTLFKEMAVFAAIATKTDMMPILNENRELLIGALDYCNVLKERNLWFGRILKIFKGLGGVFILNNKDKIIDENFFSFSIGPALNAVSRIEGDVSKLVNDIYACGERGNFLKDYLSLNNKRRKFTETLFQSLTEETEEGNISMQLINEENFDFPVKGLLGLISNKISSEGTKKVALCGIKNGEEYEFSCRSHNQYSLHEGILKRIAAEHPELKIKGGGHKSAMGLRFSAGEGNFQLFKRLLEDDFTNNVLNIEENVFILEKEMLDEIFFVYEKFKVFGNNFEKLKFFYEGSFKSFFSTKKEIEIGDYKFLIFDKFEKEKWKNKDIKVIFNIMMNSKEGPYFKIEKIIEE